MRTYPSSFTSNVATNFPVTNKYSSFFIILKVSAGKYTLRTFIKTSITRQQSKDKLLYYEK